MRSPAALSLAVVAGTVAGHSWSVAVSVRLEVGTPYSERHTPEGVVRATVPESSRDVVREQVLYDHGDPTVWEQYFLELVQRARANPAAEAALYGIDLNAGLAPGTISAVPKPPLAFNPFLFVAARAHSDWMLETDLFAHDDIGDGTPLGRIEASGYPLVGTRGIGENLAYIGSTGTLDLADAVESSHEGLVLSPGHRENLMADDFREIGIGSLQGVFTYQGTDFNALVSTHNFAYSGGSPSEAPGSSFLLGVVYEDTDEDGFYSPGEGMADVRVTPSTGGSYAVTSVSGGYAMPLPPSGRGPVRVTVSGGGWTWPMAFMVDVNTVNVKADFVFDRAGPPSRQFEVEEAVMWVPEGEVRQLRVRLTERPHSDVTARVVRDSGDADLDVIGLGEVTFTVEDYGYRDVALEAAEDDGDTSSGSALFRVQKVAGVNPIADLTGVQVREFDDDVVVTVRSNGPGTTEPEGQVTVDRNDGMPLAVRAVPDPGSSFVEWRGVGAVIDPLDNPVTGVTAVTNATVTAYFSISDTDLDGLDDQWERDQFTNLLQTADGDPDGDRITNREEMVAGFDPKQANEGLRVLVLDPGWNLVSLPTGTLEPTREAVFGRSNRGPVWGWNAVEKMWERAVDPLSDVKGYWVYVVEQVALIVEVAAGRNGDEPR